MSAPTVATLKIWIFSSKYMIMSYIMPTSSAGRLRFGTQGLSKLLMKVVQHIMDASEYVHLLSVHCNLITLYQLAKSRLDFLIANGYPQRYRDFISVKATSDDEADPTGLKIKRQNVYWIKRRPERSHEAEVFIRRLDEAREVQAGIDGKRLTQEWIRLVPQENQKDTEFLAVASQMPIDYFAPTFFNVQQPQTRKRIALMKVSLLPDVSKSFTREGKSDERLSDEAFMAKYSPSVLAKYDLDDLNDEEGEFLEDEDMEDDDDDDYMSGVVMEDTALDSQEMMTRNQLAARLSEESV
jgi:hypothetical protein